MFLTVIAAFSSKGSGEIRNEGGCTEYAFRPLICRLFGFSGVIDRLGQVAPVICKYVKRAIRFLLKRFTEKFSSGLEFQSSQII